MVFVVVQGLLIGSLLVSRLLIAFDLFAGICFAFGLLTLVDFDLDGFVLYFAVIGCFDFVFCCLLRFCFCFLRCCL